MKILSKIELNSFLGKESMWVREILVDKVSYISGIPPFDKLLDGKLFTEVVALINFRCRPNGLQIQMMKGLKYHSVGILKKNILSINLEDKIQLYEQKEKSVIGRAVIGGLILGPVGAIVGGMTGMGKKEVKSNMPDLILSVSYKESDQEKIVLFSCAYKSRKAVEQFFIKNYKNKFQVTKLDQAASPNQEHGSVINELAKLAELKEKGLLSEEEFL